MPPLTMVDVFGSAPLSGNPVAVVHDADALPDAEMLALTRWFDLSETTFLCRPTTPEADYRVRIFTPAGELPFAGHPTLGTAHAWLEAGGVPAAAGEVVQECGAGLVTVRRSGGDGPGGLSFAAPPLVRSGPVDAADVGRALDAVGLSVGDVLDAAWVDNGPGWMGLRLRSAEEVLAVRAVAAVAEPLFVGLVGPHAAGGDADVEVRAFFVDQHLGLREDPVTGSLNASLAQWLVGAGHLPDAYVAAQGTAMGRAGRVHVEADADGRIWVGGATTTVASGGVAATS